MFLFEKMDEAVILICWEFMLTVGDILTMINEQSNSVYDEYVFQVNQISMIVCYSRYQKIKGDTKAK